MTFKKFVEENLVGVDKTVKHKDGSFSLKKGFFYKHGLTAEKHAAKVEDQFKKLGVEFELIEAYEDWSSWPKDSWMTAKFRIMKF
jgi:hypothetical protein